MGEMNFSCPHCSIELACEMTFAGQEMQCPTCQGWLTAPEAPGPPPPPPPPPRRAPLGSGAGRPRSGATTKKGRRKGSSKSKSGSVGKIIKIAAVIVVFGVACYFGFGYAMTLQKSTNEKLSKAEKDSGGGQLGHIAELYDVLEATDPANYESSYPRSERSDYEGLQDSTGADFREQQVARAAEIQNLPVIAPVWTLAAHAAKVPEGRANGTISGTNFVAETTFISPVGEAQVLSLRQGAGVNPDQEILVYLHLKPGETLGEQTWTISKDMKGREVPQVVKRWKTNPKYAPRKKVFRDGYVMQLELGEAGQGGVSGKIYIAVPDEEKTVVAGAFYAIIPQVTTMPQQGGAVYGGAPNARGAYNDEF